MDKETASKRILNGNFPKSLQNLFLGKEDPFDFELRDPYYVFQPGGPKLKESLVPLFESGPFTYFYDEEDNLFLAFHLELPECKHVYGNSIQCLWAGIILNLFDDETELHNLIALSDKIGFKYPNELYSEMLKYMNDEETYETTQARILNLCSEEL